MPEDLYIPTADACMLLGCSINPASLHYHKIPHKKEFTSLYWSRNAIYALLKKRRLDSKPPKGYLTLTMAAEHLGMTIERTAHHIGKERIPHATFRMWNGKCYYNAKIYHINNIKRLAAKLRFARNSFPPEGWLELKDIASFLHLSPHYARAICKKNKVRIKAITARKFLYNEDDVVALRKARNRARYQLSNSPSK